MIDRRVDQDEPVMIVVLNEGANLTDLPEKFSSRVLLLLGDEAQRQGGQVGGGEERCLIGGAQLVEQGQQVLVRFGIAGEQIDEERVCRTQRRLP